MTRIADLLTARTSDDNGNDIPRFTNVRAVIPLDEARRYPSNGGEVTVRIEVQDAHINGPDQTLYLFESVIPGAHVDDDTSDILAGALDVLAAEGFDATALPIEQRSAAGTFAALWAQSQADQDHPRVTLPSGLSGRVGMARRHGGGYVISLFGFGVGEIQVTVSVDADADVLTAVDAALRARPDFITALRARQAEDAGSPYATSPLAQGRDRWLADLDAALHTDTLPVDAPAEAVRTGTTVSINHPTHGHVTGHVTSTAHQGTTLLSIGFYSPALGHQNRINDAIFVDAKHIARS